MPDEQEITLRRQRTAEIVAAYVKHHKLSGDHLAAQISNVHGAPAGTSVEPEPERPRTVLIRRSVHQHYLVCLDGGWRGKMLRHIGSEHQSSPAEYWARWDLPPDHPLMAPGYSEQRSQRVKQLLLGRRPQAEAVAGLKQGRSRELGGAGSHRLLRADPTSPF